MNRMQGFAQLDSLPSSLFCNILRDWLYLQSVMALNSAYCHKSRRGKLISSLQSSEYFIRENIVFTDCSTTWDALLMVGEKLRCLSVEDSLSVEQGNLIVQHCHNLTHVHFKGISSCTGELRSLLSTNPHLECVTLSTPRTYYRCPPNNFLSVADMHSAEFLSFAQGWGISDEDREIALEKNTNVTRLDFWGEQFTRSLLLQISTLCPHLTHVGLGRTNLNDEMLKELVISCPYLEHLDIADNEQITDVGVLAVVHYLRRIKSLNIMGVAKLTSTSFNHIGTHSTSTLHTLHASFPDTARKQHEGENSGEDSEDSENEEEEETSLEASSAVNHLLEHCTHLRVFHYRQSQKSIVFTPGAVCHLTTLVLDGSVVCQPSLLTISKYGVNLHTVFVGEITTFSRTSLLALVQGCPRLKRFYYELEAIDMHNIDDYDTNTRQFALAFMDLWMKLKPGLVAEQSLASRFSYKIMDM